MSTRIFKLWLVKPYFEAMELPQERGEMFISKNAQIKKDLGVRDLLLGRIWSDENITHWGVELYPDWKAVREHNRCMEEIHFYQMLHSEIFLGVDGDENQQALQPVEHKLGTEGIALIWLANLLPAYYAATDEDQAQAMKIFELQRTLGMHQLLSVRARPFNERWDGWGVEVYPSMEALIEKSAAQEKAHWWKFLTTRTFLGTIEQGDLVAQPPTPQP